MVARRIDNREQPLSNASIDWVEDRQFRIGIDPVHGIVRSEKLALQTVEDIDRYVAALTLVMTGARQRYARALLLADLRDAPIRSQIAAERLRQHNLKLYQPGERAALLVTSSLFKLQLRRNLVPEYQEIFMSENAAIMWLQASNYQPSPARS